MKMKNRVFKTSKLPFVELRYISEVLSCDKYHQHDELTITAIKEGSINIDTENKTDLLKANNLSVVNPSVIHRATLSDVVGSGCYVMYLEKKWCEKIQSSLFDDFKGFVPVADTFLNDKIFYKKFLSVSDKLLTEEISQLEKEESLVSFISEVFLQFCTSKNFLEEDKKHLELAYKIKHYIEKNMEEDILLDDISKFIGVSIVHMMRVFKKEFGLPMHSYLMNKRVHLAKNLISKGMPISEVAQISRFFDQSHLTKSFKRVFQLTPYEYQKNILS